MAQTIDATFEDVGAGDVLVLHDGSELSYAVEGTFEGVVRMERSLDNGKTWTPIGIETTDAEVSGEFVFKAPAGERGWFRWVCTEFTSGPIEASLTRPSKILFELKNDAGQSVIKVTEDGVELLSGGLDLDSVVHGTGSIELVPGETPYAEEGSHQTIAADLEVSPAAGSDDGADPAFVAAIMGNLLGEDLDGEGNYLGGVIGAISATGVESDYPSGGVLGIVMDGVTGVDGAFVAVLDGSDPSAETRARAMFACRVLNNNPDSGVDFGLDLYAEPSTHYSTDPPLEPQGLNVEIADIRLSNGLYIMSGAADPSAGDGVAAPVGSLYLRTNGEHWRKTDVEDEDWTKNGDAA